MLGLLFQRSVEHVQTCVSPNDSCREGTDVKTYRRGAFRYQCLLACCNITLVNNLCNASIFDCLLSLPARISSLQMFDLFGLQSREIYSRTGGCVQTASETTLLRLYCRTCMRDAIFAYFCGCALCSDSCLHTWPTVSTDLCFSKVQTTYVAYCLHQPLP